jgi:hypothetical protein
MKKIQDMKYAVDVPNSDVSDPNNVWLAVEYFKTRKEAVKFAQEKYGADKNGKVSLVSSL